MRPIENKANSGTPFNQIISELGETGDRVDYFVFKMLSFLFNSKKVISLDIAELNPSLDRDNLTAVLAAKIIDFVVMSSGNRKLI
ncbi:MAG: hypothetical protein DRI86_12410 [Bacteroidetes bacterium]|nr:MAG: hypothetical protein DRI86_12410 [Bacteroidota bacterium]